MFPLWGILGIKILSASTMASLFERNGQPTALIPSITVVNDFKLRVDGGCLATLPTKFSSLDLQVADRLLTLPNFLQTCTFLSLSSLTWSINILSILLMDLWWKTSSISKLSWLPDHVSQFYRAKFTGIAKYSLIFEFNEIEEEFQMKLIAPTALLALSTLIFTSAVSSRRKLIISML